MYDVVLSKSRKFFNRNIKPVVKVEYCEVCNEVNDLHIHHNEPLSITVRKVLSEFDIENVDVLVDLVSARSLREGLTVVCPECHRELHKDDMGDLVSYGLGVQQLVSSKQKENKAQQHAFHVEQILEDFYNSNTTWYDANDKIELIEVINFRENGVMRKSISKLNYFLEKRKSKYRIKKINTTNNGKRYGNAWRVVQQ